MGKNKNKTKTKTKTKHFFFGVTPKFLCYSHTLNRLLNIKADGVLAQGRFGIGRSRR
jgi:hypothetical protein